MPRRTSPTPSGVAAVDPDADLHDPGQRREWSAHRWVLPGIAVGGMIGASGRYALEQAWAPHPGEWPWATFVTNVSGCTLIGILMVYVVEVGGAHPLLRPFLGVGVLGGFTTFSTYAVQTHLLLRGSHPLLAPAYLAGTLFAAVLAVTLGVVAARALVALGHRAARRRSDDRKEAR